MIRFFFLLLLAASALPATAQQKGSKNLVYVDRSGVLRYTRDGKEAAFFGVNYTVPFAYGYRSHNALGRDIEKAIDADVAHMARLGLDAFRVHVWDVEISDSAGNLLQNEHLRLFDYLLLRLKERNIKILVTPIAFWGNGYPERDGKTPGFATKYGKGPSVVKEEAFVAQENYLRQFLRHVNPYTKQRYIDDPDVIALEINNEPHHSGPRERTTEYVNRMAAAVRGTGWTKPVFYNISESPSYAGAVLAAHVDGHSFQWYPTGLVANHEQKGNYLPHVDQYRIPFFDSLPALKNRALMVYEFDAGDVYQSNMYPAMARSFRTAGFQWATQFAYDPLATASANTEYQTHFLNLVYTPSKAVSLLIASKAFHRLPRGKSYGVFPVDTLFDVFRVRVNDGSEMNSEEEFYYSTTTTTAPRNAARLQHIAGVGSSPVVGYDGSGAYFLDKTGEGRWRLEVYPDAQRLRDPFGKASPSREAVRVAFAANRMTLRLPGLAAGFRLAGLDSANRGVTITDQDGFLVKPGIYEIGAAPVASAKVPFYVPAPYSGAPYILHTPASEVIAGKPFTIRVQSGGLSEAARVSAELRHSLNKWKTIQLQRRGDGWWEGVVPSEMLEAGLLEYRILVQQGDEWLVYPAGIKGYPYAWDYVNEDRYAVRVLPPGAPLVLFDAARDRDRLTPWISDWRNSSIGYTYAPGGDALLLRATMNEVKAGSTVGWQVSCGDRMNALDPGDSLNASIAVLARSEGTANLRVAIVDIWGRSFVARIPVGTKYSEQRFPLGYFRPEETLLLPRPYPGFQPLWFRSAAAAQLRPEHIDKIQFSFESVAASPTPLTVEVQYARLYR
ncbi:membrane or secreted protein [Flaviaesturariibacter flavus]|uniref:Membrane or secreted protein n=2 Tax=Flaviaesturariibacter flavus TaxID=2502780 RepID=A0A4R1BK49_9BACT|nr:membrane or secreted protein [Flaviaesturariibacter flavus]